MLDLANEAALARLTSDSALAKDSLGLARYLCGEQHPSQGTA